MDDEIQLISDGDGLAVAGNHVATAVTEFYGRLGIERGRPALEARRWVDAAAEVKDKALETGAGGVDAARRLGNETFDRARSVTEMPASGISERTQHRHGDNDERK